MIKKYYFLIFAIFLFSSCPGFFDRDVVVWVDFDYDTFLNEQDLWLVSKPSDYRFYLDEVGAAFDNTIITVRNNHFYTQDPQTPYGETRDIFTIDDLYIRTIAHYLYNHGNTFNSDYPYLKKITVEYDKVNHVPVKITSMYNPTKTVDDASELIIRSVKMFEKIADGDDTGVTDHASGDKH